MCAYGAVSDGLSIEAITVAGPCCHCVGPSCSSYCDWFLAADFALFHRLSSCQHVKLVAVTKRKWAHTQHLSSSSSFLVVNCFLVAPIKDLLPPS